MRRAIIIVGTLLVFVVIGVLLPPISARRPSKTIEESLKKLHSDDFGTLRRAQRELLAHGPEIVPQLKAAYYGEQDETVAGLLVSLIGDLDAQTYFRLIMDSAQTPRQSVALKYPSDKAIKKFTFEERQQLSAKLPTTPTKPGC